MMASFYVCTSSAMQKPFLTLYTNYCISLGKHTKSQDEFYSKLLPQHDTPEIRQAMVSIIENGETPENTLNGEQIMRSILKSKRTEDNADQIDKYLLEVYGTK